MKMSYTYEHTAAGYPYIKVVISATNVKRITSNAATMTITTKVYANGWANPGDSIKAYLYLCEGPGNLGDVRTFISHEYLGSNKGFESAYGSYKLVQTYTDNITYDGLTSSTAKKVDVGIKSTCTNAYWTSFAFKPSGVLWVDVPAYVSPEKENKVGTVSTLDKATGHHRIDHGNEHKVVVGGTNVTEIAINTPSGKVNLNEFRDGNGNLVFFRDVYQSYSWTWYNAKYATGPHVSGATIMTMPSNKPIRVNELKVAWEIRCFTTASTTRSVSFRLYGYRSSGSTSSTSGWVELPVSGNVGSFPANTRVGTGSMTVKCTSMNYYSKFAYILVPSFSYSNDVCGATVNCTSHYKASHLSY